jgi:hypothetical protein
MTQALTEATLAGMTLEEIQAHARYSEESTNAVVETLFKALLEARAGTGERDAAANSILSECARLFDHYQSNTATDMGRRQIIEHFIKFSASLRSPSTEKDDYRSLRSLKDGAAR